MNLTKNSLSQESSVFLNLIRFVACEMVVVCHFLTKYQPVFGETSFTLGSTIGGVAVLLFFVLSGLLISYSLLHKLENPSYGFRSFFVDRFSRIYSGLLPSMFIGAIISVVIYYTNYSYYEYLSSMQSAPSPLTFAMTMSMLERFPVNFFNSLLLPFGLSFPFPSVTPFGFNGVLWALVVEWWIYMAFGCFIFESLVFMGKRKKSNTIKILFAAFAVALSLLLIGFLEEFSSFIIVWFVGSLMLLVISNDSVRSKLSSPLLTKILAGLFVLILVLAIFSAYVAFAWTGQYYDVSLGLILSALVFVGVLFFNGTGFERTSKWILNRRFANLLSVGASFSYTLFLTHYPIIIFLSGLNLPGDRFLMLMPILLITNVTAFLVAHFTEKRHKDIAKAIKNRLGLTQ